MDKLDLKRIHSPMRGGERGQGKTVKMLAYLMGNVELSQNKELHVIFIPEGRNKRYILRSIDEVAQVMGIKIVGGNYHNEERVFENGVVVKVMHQSEKDRLRGYSYRDFYDV